MSRTARLGTKWCDTPADAKPGDQWTCPECGERWTATAAPTAGQHPLKPSAPVLWQQTWLLEEEYEAEQWLKGDTATDDDEPDRDYPVGTELGCWDCGRADPEQAKPDEHGFPVVMRKCTALGAVVNKADPTQSYELECGHTVI